MTKKLILGALAFVFAALTTSSSFALPACSTGLNIQYVGVGSSSQFAPFAAAAENLINAGITGGTMTGPLNFWASSNEPLTDFNAAVTDTATLWIAWDSSATCYVYAYFMVDSTVAVKDFFSWHKITVNGVANADTAAVYLGAGAGFAACPVGTVVYPELPLCTGGAPPANITAFLTSQPAPTCKIGIALCTATTPGALPQPYCGQNSTSQTVAKYCFFNAAGTAIRPEDALYANTRAFGGIVVNGGLTGLGYNNVVCGANGPPATIGCPFIESFGQKGATNLVKFALTGTDPIGDATLPTYTTLNVGAAPVVVIVSDADSSGLGAGSDQNSNTSTDYTITNVNRATLAGIENGTFGCTGDLRYDGSGPGVPLQILHREPIAGVYNAFEFTGVRSMDASAAAAVSAGKQTDTQWFTADDSGQEESITDQGGFGKGGPTVNWNSVGANHPSCEAGNVTLGDTPPTMLCGDPLYSPSVSCGNNGNALHLRVIGASEMVKAVSQAYLATQTSNDAFGYTFWSYGNMSSMASGCGTNAGAVTCSGYLSHYLTVDGIDPLFSSPGGSQPLSLTSTSIENPNGAYHGPECGLKNGTPNCIAIPFTHIYDGSYPLWSILRLVTFNTVTTGTALQTTPGSVLAMLAEVEADAANQTAVTNLSDFVPYLHHICPPGLIWTQPNGPCAASTTTSYTGDLNLFVLRSHYKVTGDPGLFPNNGIAGVNACDGVYTGIAITGAAGGCTVDVDNDMGGAVITVNGDADFYADFGSMFTNIYEYFGLHQ
jgi:hypothetical protein